MRCPFPNRRTNLAASTLVEGGSLAALIATARQQGREVAFARLPGVGTVWQRLAQFVAAIAKAIAVAHAAGVLHRDLKPGNVLLRADGSPVVVDFGLAADATAATLTGTGDVLGTPHYMAPEQARGETATAASDVYGLGALLFELLTLSSPRHGRDPLQVVMAARHELPPPPRRLLPEVPRELDLVTRRAMAFRPGSRYASAAELARALDLVAPGGRPIGLTFSWPLRVEEFCRRRRTVLLTTLAVGALAVVVWTGIDWRQQAGAERLRAAMIEAAECHVDNDARGLAAACQVLVDAGEVALATWMQQGDDVVVADAFVQALATGHRAFDQDAKAAVVAFQRAVDLRPDAAIAVAWLGLAAARCRSIALAERDLTSAVRSLPGRVRLRSELGRELRLQEKAFAAVPHLQHAVTMPRACAETWHELAKALRAAQQFEPSLIAIDRALAMKPGKPPLNMLRLKALVLDNLKRYVEALPLLRSILDQAPSKEVWASYGGTLDFLHRFGEAADAYRTALAIDPKYGSPLLYLAHLHAGSDRANCEQCRSFFAANPELIDAALVDQYATDLLAAQEGSFKGAEMVATYVLRVGGGERFLAGIEQRLRQDLPAEVLGRLWRAKKVLRPE